MPALRRLRFEGGAVAEPFVLWTSRRPWRCACSLRWVEEELAEILIELVADKHVVEKTRMESATAIVACCGRAGRGGGGTARGDSCPS